MEIKGYVATTLSATGNRLTKGQLKVALAVLTFLTSFSNDFNITLRNHDALFKCGRRTDYSDQLLSRLHECTNWMSCNPSRCKELTIKKRGNRDLCSPIGMIPSCKEVRDFGRHLPMWQQISFSAREEQTY